MLIYLSILKLIIFVVYHIVALMATKNMRKEFLMETDIDWVDFQSWACANLDIPVVGSELGYWISGLEGPRTLPSVLSTVENFGIAMNRIIDLISRAKSKAYGIEVVNLVCCMPSYSTSCAE